jgi:glycosyltransferase involved in cell wall biosynthesis
MRLSIITPYYKTYKYIKELAQVLEPQLTDEVEWVIIDDGCQEHRLDTFKAKVIHLNKNSGTAGKPRNIGLEIATGEYVTFIDSDDLVSNDYIKKILSRINKKPDLIFVSWKTTEKEVIMNPRPPKWNCAVWCRVYKREIIDDIRFDEKLVLAEDWVFNNQIKYSKIQSISRPIYFYNKDRKGSITTGE